MSDMTKTKAQLIQELESLRQRVVELEAMVDAHHNDESPPSISPSQLFTIDTQSSPQALQQKVERIEKTLARRIQEMTALYEISLNITAELGKTDIWHKIIEQAAMLLGTEMGRIYLLAPGRQHLDLMGSYNCSKSWTDVTITIDTGLVGHVLGTGQTHMVANYGAWEGSVEVLAEKIGRAVGVPLKRGHNVIGALVVFDGPAKQGVFDSEDVKLLDMLAAQVVVALENFQLYNTMQHKVEELAMLNRVSQAVNSTLDLQETLTLITDHIMSQLDSAAASVALYDLERDVLRFAAASGHGADFVLGQQLAAGRGIIGWVAQHGQPVLVSDVAHDERFYDAFDRKQGDFVTQSIVSVPLQARGQTIGVIAALNKMHSSAFTPDDLELLGLIAAPAATAIDNSRLYEQSQQKVEALQQAETELAQQARQLGLINDIGRQIAAELELDLLLNRAAQLVQQSFNYHHVALFLVEDNLLKLKTVAGSYQAYYPVGHSQQLNEGITGLVAQQGKKIVANNVKKSDHYTHLIEEYAHTQSELCLPIKVKEDTVGVMDIQSPTPNSFTDNDIVAMETLTNQIAVAIRNARLYQQAKQEIAERKQIERELRASEERFRQVITSISDHIYVSEVTEEGDRVNFYHSPNVKLLTGYSVDRFSQDWHFWPSTLIHPDDRFRAAAQATKLSQGQSSLVEYRIVRADGAVIWVRDSASVETKNNRTTIYGVVADITERKQHERELEIIVAIADALRSTATHTDIIAILLDQLLDLLQMEGAALVSHDATSHTSTIEQARGVWRDLSQQQLTSSQQGYYSFFPQGNLYVNNDVQSDQDIPWPEPFSKVKAVAIVSLSIQNEAFGSLIVGHRYEITADVLPLLTTISNMAVNALQRASLFEALQKSNNELANERALLAQRVEERTAELSAANAELARAARLKDEFMANMSHELRTPLNAVLGMSEILRSNVYGPLNDEQLKAVHYIEEGGNHLLSLINDILDLSKIEAGKLELLLSAVSGVKVCQSSLQFVKPIMQQKDIKIVYRYDNSVELFMADERRLKQILVNLLTNAIKFSPKGSRIGLEMDGDIDQGVVHFTVWDNGIGISDEDMRRLFKPFVQADSGLTRRQEGTGLGLSLVYRLTEMHGGSVRLESKVNEGSRFTISLPWQTPDGFFLSSDMQQKQTFEKSRDIRPPQTTVLLAEDNENAIVPTHTYLRAQGYHVVIAKDGIEAVKLTVEMQPDIILMDVQMPGISGIEAMRQIRQNHKALASIPIIALTALSLPGDRQRCFDAGADEYLCKPVNLSHLATLIASKLKTLDN
ncbi:MAG: GAF domain-containing protein [Anaerolineae bacterium]|nr:GAF domain-containing protein [Anaerolineae bacterium]